jgi:serralysin
MAQIFTVALTGSQEVPPNASTASGTGVVVWDTATDTATYAFTFRGLDLGPDQPLLSGPGRILVEHGCGRLC